MNIKALVSPLALASALAFSGGVAAQDMMLGGQPVSEDDVALVENFCADLAREDAQSDTVGTEDDNMDTGEDAADNTNDTFTNIDFDSVTLEQCEEGGFLD